MTKIDRFMYDISTIMGKWRHDYPLTERDTPEYYDKIRAYVGNELINKFIEELNSLLGYIFTTNLEKRLIPMIKKWEEIVKGL